MVKSSRVNLFFGCVFILLQIGCTNYPVIQEPNVQQFNQTVHSESLRDSLIQGKLTVGMPYFVVSQLFNNYDGNLQETQIPVASLGSKQRLQEEEGLRRVYVDPNTSIFLDIYETSEGRLYVWYQRPNFYSMDVSASDTLCVFYEDTIYCSAINYLRKSTLLSIDDSLPQIPVDSSLYAEVHYKDRPESEISYWYNIQILSNGRMFKIGNMNYKFYPIGWLEFNNEPVLSFKWREVNKNED